MSKTFIAAGDFHVPFQDEASVSILKQVVKLLKPEIFVSLGDVLDCSSFSTHPPTYGMKQTNYEDDLHYTRKLFDDIQEDIKERLVLIEGNHCQRVDRWAAASGEGKAAYSLIAPRIQLMKRSDLTPRTKCTYVPYGSVNGTYPTYRLNNRVYCCHGFSFAKNAAQVHLSISQGKSLIFGHTHRAQIEHAQSVWSRNKTITAISGGCMCGRVPCYGTGSPVNWTNGFVLGYLGTHSDTMYTIIINGDHCILPDGRKITAKGA